MITEPDAAAVPDYASLLRLDGTVQVVLGAGRGIGYQSSHALASAGARVVCVDREPDRAEAVATEVGGIAWAGEITEREPMTELFEFVVAECGRLDGVVDIVGLSRYKALIDLTDDDWLFHHTIVLKHAYLALELAGRHWQGATSGGTVTFVASSAGLTSSPNLSAYGANKAALMSLVRTAAVEFGPYGVRVNAVAPGIVRTPRAQANPKWTPELLAANIERTPLRKLAYPYDVAGAILFLSTPLSGHITGQSLVVDGGNSVVYNVESPTP
ncbi:SDR family oxidoreductase [Jatrophihabitans sp.]|uniref:SDR family NAD(P)-dependent oxidoreductase n=1 Tax=Jatrophihabitans sp. TaxID=1932789 RepID=UPI0030C72980|nr:Short-chain dehydrogenase [Jatrophihabitans sp.]